MATATSVAATSVTSNSETSTQDHSVSQIRTALADSPEYALRQLRVDSSTCGLVLSGRVATFYQKQQAQETVRLIAPQETVLNQIEVS